MNENEAQVAVYYKYCLECIAYEDIAVVKTNLSQSLFACASFLTNDQKFKLLHGIIRNKNINDNFSLELFKILNFDKNVKFEEVNSKLDFSLLYSTIIHDKKN